MSLLKSLLIFSILIAISAQANSHICFGDPKQDDQKVCYTTDSGKDSVVKESFTKLVNNISSPNDLVKLQGEMAKRYTPEKFNASLIKYYSHITPESIEQIITQGDLSAVYLKTGDVMYFSHELTAFIFDYDSPLVFLGAQKFFSKGYKPKIEQLAVNKSNCNLQKDGVIFLSPTKESFFFIENATFCSYAGLYFYNDNNTIRIKPIDQIGKTHSTLTGMNVEFANFLKWLQKP